MTGRFGLTFGFRRFSLFKHTKNLYNAKCADMCLDTYVSTCFGRRILKVLKDVRDILVGVRCRPPASLSNILSQRLPKRVLDAERMCRRGFEAANSR